MFAILTYNPSKQHQKNFRRSVIQLRLCFRQCNTLHVLFDFNLNCLNEREEKPFLRHHSPYGLQMADVHDPKRLEPKIQNHVVITF